MQSVDNHGDRRATWVPSSHPVRRQIDAALLALSEGFGQFLHIREEQLDVVVVHQHTGNRREKTTSAGYTTHTATSTLNTSVLFHPVGNADTFKVYLCCSLTSQYDSAGSLSLELDRCVIVQLGRYKTRIISHLQ